MRSYSVILVAVSCLMILSFRQGTIQPIDIIKNDIHNTTLRLVSSIDTMIAYCQTETIHSKKKQLVLLSMINTMREDYKKIEWLISYFDNESEKQIIGPPLPKLDEHIPSAVVIEPEGFQIIEEIMSDNYISIQYDKINTLLLQLKQTIIDADGLIQTSIISDRQVLEALRSNIIRIFAIGLTASDSPSSRQCIKEAYISWNTTGNYLLLYYPLIASDAQLQKTISTVLQKGGQFLQKQNNIHNFDHWTFISEYANPLYSSILLLHKQSGIEVDSEVSRKNRIIHYSAKTIFQTGAINPMAYSRNPYEMFSEEKKVLGKLLFHDVSLSNNFSMSCASCHNPALAFTDGKQLSNGTIPGATTIRNSPTLINSALSTKYFYDMSTSYLEEQIEHVVNNKIEFNTDYLEIATRLSNNQEIQSLLKKIYPTQTQPINSASISSSLAMYIRSLISFESPVDSFLRGETLSKYSLIQGEHGKKIKHGFNLFMGKAKCATCHFPPTFSGLVPPLYNDNESEVLGIPSHVNSTVIDSDLGRGAVYKYSSPIYRNSFKTPGIRNIALTAPYMHNGIYSRLEQVIDFYNEGGGIGHNIDVPNQTLPSDKLHLNKKEKENLIHFLNALNSPVSQ